MCRVVADLENEKQRAEAEDDGDKRTFIPARTKFIICIFDWPRSRRNPRPNPGPSPNPRPRPAAADYIAVVPACFLTCVASF